jgi:hypothetical protein
VAALTAAPVAIGSRDAALATGPLVRRLASLLFNRVIQTLLGLPFPDTQCDLRSCPPRARRARIPTGWTCRSHGGSGSSSLRMATTMSREVVSKPGSYPARDLAGRRSGRTTSIRSRSDARGAKARQPCCDSPSRGGNLSGNPGADTGHYGRQQMKSVPQLSSQDGSGGSSWKTSVRVVIGRSRARALLGLQSTPPGGSGGSRRCYLVRLAPQEEVTILANPAQFYVNIHNAAFPAGALSGLLG